jgi:hypothetical protein
MCQIKSLPCSLRQSLFPAHCGSDSLLLEAADKVDQPISAPCLSGFCWVSLVCFWFFLVSFSGLLVLFGFPDFEICSYLFFVLI